MVVAVSLTDARTGRLMRLLPERTEGKALSEAKGEGVMTNKRAPFYRSARMLLYVAERRK